MGNTYSELPNKLVSAANGIDYAYREVGESTVPLVLLQHFRGNLDNWDPALIDALASTRRVVTFDNAGVGGSTGTTPNTIEQMANDAIAFLAAMEIRQADILGFSIGSFVVQEIALIRPGLLRRLILASSAPQGAAGMHGWAPDVLEGVGIPEISPDGVLDVFYTRSSSSRQAGAPASPAAPPARRPAPPPPRSGPSAPRSAAPAARSAHPWQHPAASRSQATMITTSRAQSKATHQAACKKPHLPSPAGRRAGLPERAGSP
jgi:pimeloyl-ACP methyl ester carboxylesterase